MKKTLSMLLAGAMLAAALTGCGSSASTGSDSADSSTDSSASGAAFKLGGTGPLTGAAAIYGNAAKNGAQIAVDEINAEGGDIQFELNYQDDEHDAEKAVNAYNTLKDWGMQLSLGSVTSKPCEATAAENYSDRIFALTPSASSVAVTEGKDNVFQMCFMDPNQGTASAQYIAEQKLGTKIAIIWKNDDVYSTGIHDKFVEEAKTKGLEVVSDNTFTDASANDFSVQLNDAKSKGDYLAIVTLSFGEIIKNVVNVMYLGRDADGLHFSLVEQNFQLGDGGKMIINGPIGVSGVTKISTFVSGVVLILVTLFFVLNFINSRTGRAVMAVRDNKIAADSIGISVTHYKLLAFVVSAAFAGMAGTLYAMNFSTVTAAKFDFNTSILVLVFVVLGGLGNIWGSIIAATLLTLLPELLRGLSNYRMLIYAILLIAMMLFNNSSFKVRLLEKRAMRQMEKAEKAGGKKEGA